MPQLYSTTDHSMPIVVGDPSSVTRTNSIDVADAIRPRKAEPTGRFELCRLVNIKNALVGSTAVIVTVVVPLVALLAVPFCVVAR